jgi:transcriptional regulator with XRE-family HTH domain
MEAVRRIRQERGLSQQRLADMADINKVTLIRIEHGTGNPNIETLEKLADALGVELADFFPKAQASLPFEEPETAQAERRVIESLFHPWVGWLKRNAAYLTEVTHAGGVARGAHEKILADRRNTLQALDELGAALERLGIDLTDGRNRVLRRARRDLQSAFNDWTDAWLEARTTYLDSLAGSELAQARQAHDEEQERSGNIPEWLQKAG